MDQPTVDIQKLWDSCPHRKWTYAIHFFEKEEDDMMGHTHFRVCRTCGQTQYQDPRTSGLWLNVEGAEVEDDAAD